MIKYNACYVCVYTRCPNVEIIDRKRQSSDNCQDSLCIYICMCIYLYTYNIKVDIIHRKRIICTGPVEMTIRGTFAKRVKAQTRPLIQTAVCTGYYNKKKKKKLREESTVPLVYTHQFQ